MMLQRFPWAPGCLDASYSHHHARATLLSQFRKPLLQAFTIWIEISFGIEKNRRITIYHFSKMQRLFWRSRPRGRRFKRIRECQDTSRAGGSSQKLGKGCPKCLINLMEFRRKLLGFPWRENLIGLVRIGHLYPCTVAGRVLRCGYPAARREAPAPCRAFRFADHSNCWKRKLLGFLARSASAERLALCGHLAVVLRAMLAGGGAASLVAQQGSSRQFRLAQKIVG